MHGAGERVPSSVGLDDRGPQDVIPERNETTADRAHEVEALPDWTDSAVLVYGARKSGTTMLANLHDGGDELLFFPSEIKLKQFAKRPWPDASAAADFFYSQSRQLGGQFPNFDSRRYAERVERVKAQGISSLRDLLRHDVYAVYRSATVRPETPRMWGMKEVGGDTEKILQLFRTLFADGRIVMIVRDPGMVTRSVLLDRRRKGIRLGAREILFQVRSPMDVLYAQTQLLDDPAIHFTTYEWLTGGFLQHEMKAICRYLGIAHTPVLEQTTIFGEPVVTRTASQQVSGVFRNRPRRNDGLSPRERLLVFLFSGWLRFRRLLARRRLMPYADIVRRIETRRTAGC